MTKKTTRKKRTARKVSKKSAVSKKSQIVAIVSDIHFDLHDVPTWKAFRKWHAAVKPHKTVILGDFVDLGMMSRYVLESDAPIYAIPQIQAFVKEANSLAKEADEVVVLEGNHDERWGKLVHGSLPAVFRDAVGLTLQDQCRAQGLNKDIKWINEDVHVKGVKCGPFLLRHGHKQGGRFGGGKHLAANRIMKSLGQNEVFGHYHRAQMFCQTAHGKTAVAIANPHMTINHGYNPNPDWQRGFTVLELYGPDNKYATPHLILIEDGHFAWHGVVYDGNSP